MPACYICGCLARVATRRILSEEWRHKLWMQFCSPSSAKFSCVGEKHFSAAQFYVVNGKNSQEGCSAHPALIIVSM